jgi:hypothetical protein
MSLKFSNAVPLIKDKQLKSSTKIFDTPTPLSSTTLPKFYPPSSQKDSQSLSGFVGDSHFI